MTPGEGIPLGVLSDLCRPAFPVGPDSISDQTGKKSYFRLRSRASFKNAEMTWSNTIVKYEQHFVILNFGLNERTVTEKLWRCWDGWKFENFRKIRGEERFQPRPQSLLSGKREDPGDEAEILVPDFTLTANFKMAAQERAHVTHRWSK